MWTPNTKFEWSPFCSNRNGAYGTRDTTLSCSTSETLVHSATINSHLYLLYWLNCHDSSWMFKKHFANFLSLELNDNVYVLHLQIKNDWVMCTRVEDSDSHIEAFHQGGAETWKHLHVEWPICTWSETAQWNYFGKCHEIEGVGKQILRKILGSKKEEVTSKCFWAGMLS